MILDTEGEQKMKSLGNLLFELVVGIMIIPIALIYGVLYFFNGIYSCYELLHTSLWGEK